MAVPIYILLFVGFIFAAAECVMAASRKNSPRALFLLVVCALIIFAAFKVPT